MLTPVLDPSLGRPLYEQLYLQLRRDIESGSLIAGEKLPSKRALSAHLKVSVVTVEGAYGQLLAEGYIRSEPKRGFLSRLWRSPHPQPNRRPPCLLRRRRPPPFRSMILPPTLWTPSIFPFPPGPS